MSGLRGCELRDTSCRLRKGPADTFFSLFRAKRGQKNHQSPLLYAWPAFAEGVALLRSHTLSCMLDAQEELKLKQVPWLAPLDKLYRERFGAALHIHQLRRLHVAACFALEQGAMPFERQISFESAITRYLGHRSGLAAEAYCVIGALRRGAPRRFFQQSMSNLPLRYTM